MIKVKNIFEAVEKDDGVRIWVEPYGLTKDLREWCAVDHVLPHLGPPMALWHWFEEHPAEYSSFRSGYHDALLKSSYRTALRELSQASVSQNFTLVHAADDATQNSATALQTYLLSLGAKAAGEA